MLKARTLVRSQLIPLDNMRLILPNTVVAEVINFEQPKKMKQPPDWLMGTISWRGLQIPIVKFETLASGKAVKVSKRSRIIVLNTISKPGKLAFYGVLSQGIPRLMSLTDENIIDSPDTNVVSFVLRKTLIDGNEAVIPDQAAIEAEISSIKMSA